MARRVLPLLLAVLVVAGTTAESCALGACPTLAELAGAPAGPHATHGPQRAAHDGRHAAHGMHAGHAAHGAMAAEHACCEREGISRPPCCPAMQLGPEQASPAGGRASHTLELAAAVPATLELPHAPVPRPVPPHDGPPAPPDTLIEQHTSLLL